MEVTFGQNISYFILRSSTCPSTGFFWLLSHLIYLKLKKYSFQSLVMGSRTSFSVSQQLRPELSAKWMLSILSDLPIFGFFVQFCFQKHRSDTWNRIWMFSELSGHSDCRAFSIVYLTLIQWLQYSISNFFFHLLVGNPITQQKSIGIVCMNLFKLNVQFAAASNGNKWCPSDHKRKSYVAYCKLWTGCTTIKLF